MRCWFNCRDPNYSWLSLHLIHCPALTHNRLFRFLFQTSVFDFFLPVTAFRFSSIVLASSASTLVKTGWPLIMNCSSGVSFKKSCVAKQIGDWKRWRDFWYVLVKILCLLVALNKHGGYIDISKLFMGITMLAHLYNLASVGAHPVNWLQYFTFQACFKTSSSAETIVVSELKSTLRWYVTLDDF